MGLFGDLAAELAAKGIENLNANSYKDKELLAMSDLEFNRILDTFSLPAQRKLIRRRENVREQFLKEIEEYQEQKAKQEKKQALREHRKQQMQCIESIIPDFFNDVILGYSGSKNNLLKDQSNFAENYLNKIITFLVSISDNPQKIHDFTVAVEEEKKAQLEEKEARKRARQEKKEEIKKEREEEQRRFQEQEKKRKEQEIKQKEKEEESLSREKKEEERKKEEWAKINLDRAGLSRTGDEDIETIGIIFLVSFVIMLVFACVSSFFSY